MRFRLPKAIHIRWLNSKKRRRPKLPKPRMKLTKRCSSCRLFRPWPRQLKMPSQPMDLPPLSLQSATFLPLSLPLWLWQPVPFRSRPSRSSNKHRKPRDIRRVDSQKLLANPVARPMIEALDYAQRTNTIGSLRADDVSRSITANNSLVRIAESDNGSIVMAAVASRMSSAVDSLTDRLNEPFVTVNTVTGDHGIQKAQDDYTRLMNNITPKSKRKRS